MGNYGDYIQEDLACSSLLLSPHSLWMFAHFSFEHQVLCMLWNFPSPSNNISSKFPESILFIMSLYLYHWEREHSWNRTHIGKIQIADWTSFLKMMPLKFLKFSLTSMCITRTIWWVLFKITYFPTNQWLYSDLKSLHTIALIFNVTTTLKYRIL